MKKYLQLIFTLLFSGAILIPFNLLAQNSKIDSLLVALSHSKEDTNKVNVLNSIGRELINVGNYNGAIKYANDAKTLAVKKEFNKGIAKAFYIIGLVYYYQGNYPEALKNCLQSLKISEEIGDKKGAKSCYNHIGTIYINQGNYPEALKNLFLALKISEEMGSKKAIADTYNNIGIVYEYQLNYSEALKNYYQALKISEEIGDNQNIASCYMNIGNIYYYRDKYDSALKNYLQALKIREDAGEKVSVVASKINIGSVYIKQKNYIEANKYLLNALQESKDIGVNDYLKECYSSLAELAEATGNYKNAFEYHKLYSEIKDSLLNENNSKQIAEMKTKYETEKKDNEIALLNIENKANAAEVGKQKLIKWVGFSFTILIILLAIVFFRNMKLRYKTEQIIQQNEIRQKISRDLHDEIGAGLTSISMICEQIKIKNNQSEHQPYNLLLDKISTQSRDVSEKLGEVVWATNPENDNLEDLVSYMRSYVSKFFEDSTIRCKLDLPEHLANAHLNPDVSRNLFFVLKEALNNCAKHSGSTHVEVAFHLNENKKYNLEIADNGKGIDYNSIPSHRNGLSNMRKRIEDIKGTFKVKSEIGRGTRIEVSGTLG